MNRTPANQARQTDIAAEQAQRSQSLFAAIVLAAIDDAIDENAKFKNGIGTTRIRIWAKSDDGQEILTLAGIDPSKRAIDNLAIFVELGEKTSISELMRIGART
mgnify:FL=1|tara:strand:+ start:1170 stop:1481 length:312 start_codon:yes stop_codon:yes gene_type:complete